MSDVNLAEAEPGDVDLLVTLMREFYAESGYPLDPERARAAFEDLQRAPVFGRAFLIKDGDQVAGYLVLTLTFSMEYGGLTAFLDDLYLRPAYRGHGVGTKAIGLVLDRARRLGVRAIHLEVGRDNGAAQAVYRKAGFVENDRQFLTLRLEPAAHEIN